MGTRRTVIKTLAPHLMPDLEKAGEHHYSDYYALAAPKDRKTYVTDLLNQMGVERRWQTAAREYLIMRMRLGMTKKDRCEKRTLRYQEILNKQLTVESKTASTSRRELHLDQKAASSIHEEHIEVQDEAHEDMALDNIMILETPTYLEEDEPLIENPDESTANDPDPPTFEEIEEQSHEPPLGDEATEKDLSGFPTDTFISADGHPGEVIRVVREEVEVDDDEESGDEIVEVVVMHVRRKKHKKNRINEEALIDH